jgi:hypothetical protein
MILPAFMLLVVFVVCCTAGGSGSPLPTKLLTISEICTRVPGARGASRVRPATITRWILQGCRSRTGERVKLAAIRVGGRWMVEESRLEQFFSALAGSKSDTATTAPTVRTDNQRSRASRRAADELARRGA